MPDDQFTFDVKGILAWAKSSGNQFAVAQEDVVSGKVKVFSVAYNECKDAYEDDLEKVIDLNIKREQLTEEHRMSIIAIADRAKATFGRRGTYDDAVDWKMAGIACCDKLTIVTDEIRKVRYSKINGVKAITFDEYISSHE